ncbi:TetR family transcriptional regulator [Tsukamurella pseudospumae]|uniref:TetR family transcriptional regulator n=1 Tax=Tsukamurella pseudospumae TaxID=239498 RepID=A0A137ZYK3_9ACTN|nr:TetR family transcriptional regulator [Tsukamurella pseudospumae]KXO99523.1 TetR family transcriptional regulator [Tsukamurella pseudospumae]KXP03276.1 TetR family transcriptional regulator [Tsukamurella pseudospumae]
MATGRRAGTSTAKTDILEAARELFAEVGYDRTTIRAIAARAGVDVALVSYYYGNKKGLFRGVMSMPVDPEEIFTAALDGPREGVGERLVRAALTVWEGPETTDAFRALLRGAISADEGAANTFGEFLSSVMIPTLTKHAGIDIATARVVASTMFGLAFLRYLVAAPLFREPTADELVAAYGAAIQNIVDGAAG